MAAGESGARIAMGMAAGVYWTRWQAPRFAGPWVSNFACSRTYRERNRSKDTAVGRDDTRACSFPRRHHPIASERMMHDTSGNDWCRFQPHPTVQPHQPRQLWKLPARQLGEIPARFAWAANLKADDCSDFGAAWPDCARAECQSTPLTIWQEL
jgi:hypothetical protein